MVLTTKKLEDLLVKNSKPKFDEYDVRISILLWNKQEYSLVQKMEFLYQSLNFQHVRGISQLLMDQMLLLYSYQIFS